MKLRASAALAAILPLAACASAGGDYPSLAIRDIERVSGEMQPAPPAYVAPPTPAGVVDRIDALAQAARAADQAFTQETPAARTAISAAAGSAQGEERWARGHVALAALEAARSRAMIALADLDRLYVDAALDNAELTRIEAVRSEVASQVDRQDGTIAQLQAGLRQ